jgi:hypothetical protein
MVSGHGACRPAPHGTADRAARVDRDARRLQQTAPTAEGLAWPFAVLPGVQARRRARWRPWYSCPSDGTPAACHHHQRATTTNNSLRPCACARLAPKVDVTRAVGRGQHGRLAEAAAAAAAAVAVALEHVHGRIAVQVGQARRRLPCARPAVSALRAHPHDPAMQCRVASSAPWLLFR